MHRGFYSGATEHLEDIVLALRQIDRDEGKKLPVWVTGHSLGGAYCNALLLQLLESGRNKDLFEEGLFLTEMICHRCIPFCDLSSEKFRWLGLKDLIHIRLPIPYSARHMLMNSGFSQCVRSSRLCTVKDWLQVVSLLLLSLEFSTPGCLISTPVHSLQ